MRKLSFADLADYLQHGREIEFAYNGRQYSITNHSGFWYLCDDTDLILLDTLCRFEETDLLVSRIAMYSAATNVNDARRAERLPGHHCLD